MLSPAQITKALSAPGSQSAEIRAQAQAMLEEYPFFIIPQLILNGPGHSFSATGLQANPVLLDRLNKPYESGAGISQNVAEETNASEILSATGSSGQPDGREQEFQSSVTSEPVAEQIQAQKVPEDASDATTTTAHLSEVGTVNIPSQALPAATVQEEPLRPEPASAQDYFRQQGIDISDALPVLDNESDADTEVPADQSLMVMRSFAEWLTYYKRKSARDKEEEEDKRSLRTAWQKEKLAAALEEENEEIPEQVFEMAVSSISAGNLASEPLAKILVQQGKFDKAIEMYRKLSVQNPQKSSYFAARIQQLQQQSEQS